MSAARRVRTGTVTEDVLVRNAVRKGVRGVAVTRTGRYRATLREPGAPVLTIDTRTGEQRWSGKREEKNS